MANRRLEEYVASVETRLRTLPAEERHQQVAELRQHLESLVACAQTEGASEEIATENALQQFGNAREVGADLNRTVWRMRFKRMPETLVTALSVVGSLSAVSLLLRFGYSPIIRAIVPPLPTPTGIPSHAAVTVIGSAWMTPSLVVGIMALGVLLCRDGVTRTARRFLNPQTIAGAAFLWLLVSRLSQSVLMIALYHALISHGLWDLPTLQAISPVFGVVPAAFAGWVVARSSPRVGIQGIAAGIGAVTVMSVIDIAVNSGPSYFTTAAFVQSFVMTTVTFTVSAFLLAGLASGLSRGQRHEQTT